ncbi:MAG: hypothetical protein COA71_03350 [SAR86 cluster bacterium]|uniref:MAPEG family protein n=1 Tax=SAR86 cluster bacterium TaxID=2030880 RepID=A0A2A5CGD0_9GAMM|nr:MAPEG family protein [bacterium AH-315-I11]MBN4075844.1 MAPEG family protein [Gammaproteobacteria bacterium AH-315-E17]PCJ42561.1 MAG: hypothetical protein COA71_03350 [SAR86 cluster bacterium]
MIIAMSAMVFLTAVIGLMTLMTRINAIRSGKLNPDYFKFMKGDEVPEDIVVTSRAFSNQFEVPLLFYVVTVLYLFLMPYDTFGFVLAWLFVFSRYVHAYIHLTYNHIIHRLIAFLFGFICVITMWINMLINNFF